MLLLIQIPLTIPISAIAIHMLIKITHFVYRPLLKCICFKLTLACKLISLWAATSAHKEEQQVITDSPAAGQQLIEPTSTVLSYGTCINN